VTVVQSVRWAQLECYYVNLIIFLQPEFVGELPRGLGAHDFGLKDFFSVAALFGSGFQEGADDSRGRGPAYAGS